MEYKTLLNFVNFHIEVNCSIPDESYNWRQRGDKNILEVGINYFQDSSRLQYSSIIYENIRDHGFYNVITSYYAKKYKQQNVILV